MSFQLPKLSYLKILIQKEKMWKCVRVVLALSLIGMEAFCFCLKSHLILSHSVNEVLKVLNSDVDKFGIKIEIWNVVLLHF